MSNTLRAVTRARRSAPSLGKTSTADWRLRVWPEMRRIAQNSPGPRGLAALTRARRSR
jgi:hypothetical protein